MRYLLVFSLVDIALCIEGNMSDSNSPAIQAQILDAYNRLCVIYCLTLHSLYSLLEILVQTSGEFLYRSILRCVESGFNMEHLLNFTNKISALLFFDVAITLEQEIQRIWQKKFSGATFVYLLTRYVALAERITLMVSLFLITEDNEVSTSTLHSIRTMHRELTTYSRGKGTSWNHLVFASPVYLDVFRCWDWMIPLRTWVMCPLEV